MTTKKSLTFAAAALAASVSLANAQTAQDHAAHHPADQAATQVQPTTPGPKPDRKGMMGDNGTMCGQASTGDQAKMVRMTTMMRMMDAGTPVDTAAPAADPFRHIEGQLIFFKSKLHVTDAQLPQWNAFADALRTHAARLVQLTAQTSQTTGVAPAPGRAERQIAVLSTQRNSMRAVLVAAEALYSVLTDDQTKVADELVTEHMVSMSARGL